MCTFGSLEYPPETHPDFICPDYISMNIAHSCRCSTSRGDTRTVTCDCLICLFFGLDLGLAVMLRKSMLLRQP